MSTPTNNNSHQTAAEATPTSGSTRLAHTLHRSTEAPDILLRHAEPEVIETVTRELRGVLDGAFPEARSRMREFLDHEDALPRYDLDLEGQRAHVTGQLQRVLDTGLPQQAFRVDQGGTFQTGNCLTSIEMLGHADLAVMVKSGVQWGLFGGAVGNLGTERHVPLVKDLIELRALGCFAMTERGHGSDVQNIETTATYDPETSEFIINSPTASSEKWYIGNAARDGRWAAVFAQLYVPSSGKDSLGVHCFVVRIREDDGSHVEGVHLGDHGYKGGLKGVDNGTLSFDNVRIPREALLNRFADVDENGVYSSPIENVNRRFFTMLGALVRGRVTVGAAAGAATRTALDIATSYANIRRQFAPDESLPEKRLIEHRNHRLRLIPRIARSYGLQLATNKLIQRLDELDRRGLDPAKLSAEDHADQREVEAHAAALKAANTDHATDTIQDCREACGGIGYMAENLLTTLKADSDIFTTFEGDNVVMLQLAGKQLITGYAKEVGDLSPLEMVRFGLDSFSTLLRRRTAADAIFQNLKDAFTDSEETSLFDPAWQAELIEERENRLLMSLGRRLRSAKKLPVQEAADLVDKAQDHLIAVARAHVDRIVFEALIEAESQIQDKQAQLVFEQVRDVFFLDYINRHASWYLEQNLLSGKRTKSARAALNDLVDSLGPWSQVLVDAFGIPENITDLYLMQHPDQLIPKYESSPAQVIKS